MTEDWNDRDSRMVAEFRKRLPDDIKSQIRAILVYGSRARGDATEDSDLDVVALVEDKTPEIERKLHDIAYDVMWDFDFIPMMSLKVFSTPALWRSECSTGCRRRETFSIIYGIARGKSTAKHAAAAKTVGVARQVVWRVSMANLHHSCSR